MPQEQNDNQIETWSI